MLELSPLRVAIISLIVTCAAHGTRADAEIIVPLHTVALTGQSAPGQSSGVNIGTIHISSVNNNGWASVAIGLTGPGVPAGTEASRWRWHEGNGLEIVVRQRVTPAPGDPGQTFDALGALTQTSTGRSVYSAEIVAGSRTGIYTDAFGAMTKVLRRGDPAPGFPTGATMSFVDEPVSSNTGPIAVQGTVQYFNVFTPMLWLRTSTGLNEVVRSGTPVPPGQLPPGTNWQAPFRNRINDSGSMAFSAMSGAGSNTVSGGSVWSASAGSTPKLIAAVGDPAPGIPGATFHDFSAPSINRHGTVVFPALAGQQAANFGLWIADANGNVSLRVAPNQQAPSYPAGVLMHNNLFPTINARGDVLFRSFLQERDTLRSSWWFSSSNGSLQEVAGLGEQAPGLPDGVVFDLFGTPGTNAVGDVFFWARLAGPGINTTNRGTLWSWNENDDLRLLMREGDFLELSPGQVLRITDLPRVNAVGSNDDGAGNRLNDLGQLAFHATLSDGRTGAFIILIPEPAAGLLSLGAVIALALRCRRSIRRSV